MSSVFWSKEEVQIVKDNITASLSVLYKLLLKHGSDRSYEAIRKQKRRLYKQGNITSSVLEDKPLEKLLDVKNDVFKEKTTLVIPDCHIIPDDNFNRFICLNRLIKDRKPDNIVFLGDFLNMSSLNHWNKNSKLKMEGIRYKADIDAGNKALDYIFNNINYKPNIIWCWGNHDQAWVERYLELNPQLEGHIDTKKDLRLLERGIITQVDYKKYIELEGVLFTHCPINAANSGVGGKFAAQKASDLVSKSLVYGHTHSCQQYNCKRHGDDSIVQIYVAGAFFEEGNIEDYAEDGTMPHNFGVSLLTHYKLGRFDIEQISLDRLKAKYK